jgi:carboxymethylenebutenolidase
MDERVKLKSADGFEMGAYVARPEGEPVGGLVVIQEIFGVNHHIRNVADRFANEGFFAVAPALFDRIQPNFETGYEGEEREAARAMMKLFDFDKGVADIAAAIDYAARETGKKVGVIGYCLGGSLAWLAATRLNPAVAVGYYGGKIAAYAAEQPKAPVMLHFGIQDKGIPPENVAKVQEAHPEVEIYWYDAGHGFSCDARASYNEAATKEALSRTLPFLKKHLA